MNHSGDPKSRGCEAISEETGDVCGETSTLRILDEFRKLYEDRIRKISDETDGGSDHTKLKIMEEWVKDLGEQNAMLVRTVEELEHEAANRVILLEEKLHQSAAVVSGINRQNMAEDGSMAALENRVYQLKKDEETLQQKIEFLQSDIRGLLELIRRARRENCWSLDGITFFEIQPSDIPAPLDCTCGQVNSCVVPDKKVRLILELGHGLTRGPECPPNRSLCDCPTMHPTVCFPCDTDNLPLTFQ